MRRLILVLFIVSCLSGFLLAQTTPLTVTFSPSTIALNVLNASAFDPVNPNAQTVLTNLSIRNTSTNPIDFYLNLTLKWNDSGNPLVSTSFPSLVSIEPGEVWNLSNRDLITDRSSQYFGEPVGDISLESIMKGDRILRSALESGIFPDGTLNFYVTATPHNKQLRSSSATFVISITNLTTIFLSAPGKPLGQNPPKVNMKPVTFLWNSMKTEINPFHLTIKEYVPGIAPDVNTAEITGRTVFEQDVSSNMFAEFLPFQNGYYYTWRIQTSLYNESNPQIPGMEPKPSNLTLKSQWFVFQFDDTQPGNDTDNQQFTAILNMFNDPQIRALFNSGFVPTGVVIFEGRTYTGQDAIDLINALVGKTLTVEIKEQ